MSSGSYFPPPVRAADISKKDGGRRRLGVPTVSDRIAQMVAKIYFEPNVEPYFHQDSYGYRPGKSAIEAVGVTRKKCWWYDWVLDLDIKGFFDNIDHQLLMRAVRKHTGSKWLLLYISRWLKASIQLKDGSLERREKGSPQGSVISPLLTNLFLHYAFDEWMKRNHKFVPFERYADDIVVHCRSEKEARFIKAEIDDRLLHCKLELHPEKTKFVYCKDGQRRGSYPIQKFDFLGYTFRPRLTKSRSGQLFVNFSPAISDKARKEIHKTIREWKIHLKSDQSIDALSKMFNPVIRGWINYYGKYYKSALYPILNQLNKSLMKWAMRKYKMLRGRQFKAFHWLGRVMRKNLWLFAHWRFGVAPTVGR
jgi:RNA-directed DNA polymerase